MYMFSMTIHPLRRMNLKASLLIPMLALSMLAVSLPFATSQAATQMPLSLAKISPALFDKIAAGGNAPINVLIETYTNDYSRVVSDIVSLGGNVRFQYQYVNALSASVPADSIALLARNENIAKIYLDVNRELSSGSAMSSIGTRGAGDLEPQVGVPTILENVEYQPASISPQQLASLEPTNYWNPTAMKADEVWAEGYMGQGSLVAIIDTGIWTGHFMFAGTSIIGGVDLSDDVGNATYEGWDNPYNHWHGSHVAGILASTGGIVVPATDPLAVSIEMYSGETLPSYNATHKIIWLLGMAPFADLYIIKVFDHTGGGVPESYILAAMEHAINLKIVDEIDVDVISMSLGGPTLFDGRDVEDQLVDFATENEIALVAAAGNDGPAQMTVGSPGSANTAITVGAAAHPVNTRVFWDYIYGYLGIGYYLFTSDKPQIHAFSSRGPTSDGRLKPTVSATGIFVLSAYPTGGIQGIAWASGTSMATPAVSGGVALLNSYAEANWGEDEATPEDYRQAITKGAKKLEGYNKYDQGAGYLNVEKALEKLKKDKSIGDEPPQLPRKGKLAKIANIPIKGSGVYSEEIEELKPGHKMEFVFQITAETDSITLDITDVDLNQANDPLGMNSFEVYIQSAKRTFYAYYIETANVWGDASFVITDDATTWSGPVTGVYSDPLTRQIEPGFMKIVIENDWTSFAPISCEITITVTESLPPIPDVVIAGKLAQGEWTGWILISVPSDTTQAIIELWWKRGWNKYPTSDLDLVIYWDMGYNFDGATLNAPERVVLDTPTFLYLYVDGYTVYTRNEPFTVYIWFV